MVATTPPVVRPQVSRVAWRELPGLHRLFERAVRIHFAYFSDGVQRQIIRDHNFRRLAKAKLDSRRVILVARHHHRVVGYCIAAVPTSGPAQLFWLYVDPQYRGTNTGLSLLSRALKEMTALGAEQVFLATHDHRRYYERQGFQFVRHELQQGIDMDIMQFTIRRPS